MSAPQSHRPRRARGTYDVGVAASSETGRMKSEQPLDCSKEMLEVDGRPVIDYPVERMRAAACDELRVVTRPEKDLDLTRTPFIGDDERDALAAHAAGCPAAFVSEELSLLDLAGRLVAEGAEVAAR
jgi:hypothetical protein